MNAGGVSHRSTAVSIRSSPEGDTGPRSCAALRANAVVDLDKPWPYGHGSECVALWAGARPHLHRS